MDNSDPPATDQDDAEFGHLRLDVPSYQIIGILGEGGQARVYKAIDLTNGNIVAIRMISGGSLPEAHARIRFEREIIAIKALDHPGIVKHLASGRTPAGHYYLTMSFIEGQRLEEYLWERGTDAPLELEARLQLFLKICHAVGAVHLAGITHRDLCPSNILVDPAGEPYIIDFGLALAAFDRFPTQNDNPVTATHHFTGKLEYVGPERVGSEGSPVDVRSDVYSLGVILYRILADGNYPYDVHRGKAYLLEQIITKTPKKPFSAAGRSGKGLHHRAGKVALRALRKSPGDRYESASALAFDLERCLSSRRGLSRSWRVPRKWLAVAAVVIVAVVSWVFNLLAGLHRPGLHLATNPQVYDRPVFQTPSTTQTAPSLHTRPIALAADFPLTSDEARKIQRDYAAAAGLPISTALKIDANNTVEFKLIPPGHYLTSPQDEPSPSLQEDPRRITISHAFYLARTQVTVAQFDAFIRQSNYTTDAEATGGAFALINEKWEWAAGACWHEPGFVQSPDNPVVEITWSDSAAFCDWLSKATGRLVRLPTSAEWEYACRSGTATQFNVGDTWDAVDKAAWCRPNSMDKTHPVAQKIPNSWGLYDMHGNVTQWCQDWFTESPIFSSVDPTGPEVGERHVRRGGSWIEDFTNCRSSWTASNYPNAADSVEGFRILLEVPPSAAAPQGTNGKP